MSSNLKIVYRSNSFKGVSKLERFGLRRKMVGHQCKIVFLLHNKSNQIKSNYRELFVHLQINKWLLNVFVCVNISKIC